MPKNMPKKINKKKDGRVIRIQGPIIDVLFDKDTPEVFEALEIVDRGEKLVLETEFEIGNGEVRTLALGATDVLKRGQRVKRTYSPIKVPTGQETLGRIFNVLGNPIDGLGKVGGKNTKSVSIHKLAPALSEQSTKPEMLETGIK